MRSNIKLGRVAGVDIGIHYSWFLIAGLVTFSLLIHFSNVNPDWGTAVVWAAALITGILFFAGIVLHELAHALVGRSFGTDTRQITLFALGGLAHAEGESKTAKAEFWMAFSGPLTSLAIGFVCLAAAFALGWQPPELPQSPLRAVLVWLGTINIVLAVFNMIPGFPLDGGRVLRAILWWISKDRDKSTRIAATVGQLVALGFILWGLYLFFAVRGFGGLWLALIGWFLLQAARASYEQVEAQALLEGVRVRDVMSTDCPSIESGWTLRNFVDEVMLRTGRRCFIVQDDGYLAGLITPGDIRKVERDHWDTATVGETMRPMDQLKTIAPDTPVMKALELMAREDVNQLPVISEGRFHGIFSRAQAMQLLQSRAELMRR